MDINNINDNKNDNNIPSNEDIPRVNKYQIPQQFSEQFTYNKDGVDLYELELRNRGNIPNFNDPKIQINLKKNRLDYNPNGSFQLGILEERNSLYNMLRTQEMIKMINSRRAAIDITQDDIEVVKYIPNSRFAWFNKLIKSALQNDMTTCDQQALLKIWLSPENRGRLQKLTNKLVDPRIQDFTMMPTNRSGMRYKCERGLVRANFYNPGSVALPYEDVGKNNGECHGCSSSKVQKDDVVKVIDNIINAQNEIANQIEESQYNESFFGVNMDAKMKKLLMKVREFADKNQTTIKEAQQLGEYIAKSYNDNKLHYLLSIVNPFRNRIAKIPTEIPIPSSSFSIRQNFNLISNASGNVAFGFNPFALYANTTLTTFGVNNDATLSGSTTSNFFTGVDAAQNLPIALYSKFRLVSSAIRLTFTSSQLSSTGFATVSVDFSDVNGALVGVPLATLLKYGLFSNIENAYFKESKATKNGDTLDLNYIPIDSSFTDYLNVGSARPGFTFVGYISGAEKSTTIARIDLVANYEALVATEYTDYLPSQVYTGSLDELKTVNSLVSTLQQRGQSPTPENLTLIADEQNKTGDSEGSNEIIDLPLSKANIENKANEIARLENIKNAAISIIPDKKFIDYERFNELATNSLKSILKKGVNMIGKYFKNKFNL